MIVQSFDLNMIPDQSPVVVHCDQYDHGTGRFIISLYNGSVAYTPPGGSTAVIQGIKPDRKGFQYSASISGNTVTADLKEQMSIAAGDVKCQIIVTETSGRIGSFTFVLRVQSSALPHDSDMSESEYETIAHVLEVAEDIEQYASVVTEAVQTATTKASEASSSASRAAQSATSASTSATNAHTSEVNAISSETNATTSATAAAQYASNASASATQAQGYASNAATSASSASDSADDALGYASTAAGSTEDAEAWATGKRGGVDVPSTDPTYHNNARYYAGKSNGGALTGLEDVAIQNIKNGQFIEYDSTEQKFVNKMVKTTLTGVLTAGQSSITFNNAAITATCRFDVYVENAYIELENATVGTNSLTLVFPEQDQNMNVKVVLTED